METKIKYLGQFELTTFLDEDYYDDDSENPQEYIEVFANVEDDSDYYESELFMGESLIIEGIGQIHGVYGETNNSSVVLQFDEDDCEVVKLWRLY